MLIDFPSYEHYAGWQAGIDFIKETIDEINDDGAPGAPRAIKYRAWLSAFYAFANAYTHQLVPADIRRSVNIIEDHLGRERTVWEA